jgi:hypothetical protein
LNTSDADRARVEAEEIMIEYRLWRSLFELVAKEVIAKGGAENENLADIVNTATWRLFERVRDKKAQYLVAAKAVYEKHNLPW